MRLKRWLCAVLAALTLLFVATALAESPSDYDISAPQDLKPGHLFAESALLIDEDSGEVLLSKNSRVRMYPASTTKIMTLLLALERGIDFDSSVTIPDEAADVPADSSLIPVKPGDVMTWRDLLYSFMLSSGNDGANAIAVLVDGGIDAFVAHMNRRADELGCEGTHYANPTGYHDDDHYTTAQDLATIARAAMQNPDFRAIVAAPTWDATVTRRGETRTGTIVSRNILLQSDQKYYYPDCTGIKTGHHRRAGWCFVGSAERDGRRVICVVLKCDEQVQGWYDAARLFEYGFTRYESVPVAALLSRAAERCSSVQIANASPDDFNAGLLALEVSPPEGGGAVPVVAGSERAMDAAVERAAAAMQVEWTRALEAPVAAGEVLGRVRCALAGGEPATATLTASRAVAAPPTVTVLPATQAPEATMEAAPETAPPVTDEAEARAPGRRGGRALLVLIAALATLLAVALAIRAVSRAQARKRRRRRRRGAAVRPHR